MARTPPKRPLEQIWKDRAHELYMRFNMLPGYDRPVLMEYVGEALRAAYEQGRAGEEFSDYLIKPTAPEVPVVRRSRPAPVVHVESDAPVRVVRRRTSH